MIRLVKPRTFPAIKPHWNPTCFHLLGKSFILDTQQQLHSQNQDILLFCFSWQVETNLKPHSSEQIAPVNRRYTKCNKYWELLLITIFLQTFLLYDFESKFEENSRKLR